LQYYNYDISCKPKEKADLIIINGEVLTINNESPNTEAIAVKGEKIIAVGSTTSILGFVEKGKTKVIDAHGRMVLPGSMMHMFILVLLIPIC